MELGFDQESALEPGEIVGFDKDALILSSVQAIDFVYFLL
jgi:hypothetical protein